MITLNHTKPYNDWFVVPTYLSYFQNLEEHRKKKPDCDATFRCSECGKTFNYKSSWTSHTKLCGEQICKCGKKFSCYNTLGRARYNSHVKKCGKPSGKSIYKFKYECESCCYRYQSQELLDRHLKMGCQKSKIRVERWVEARTTSTRLNHKVEARFFRIV